MVKLNMETTANQTINQTRFAKEYSAEITLAYYCGTFFVALVAFLFGAVYVTRRDRKDQQRREWRKFAKSVFSENSTLRAQDIPRRISKVKDTFEKIQMTDSRITGVDVLRYMLAEGNYERSKTTELECLHKDLQSIFQLFSDIHSSLPLLGKVPKYVKEELKDVVTELGMMAKPFFKGGKRKMILKCLKNISNLETDENRIQTLDNRLEEAIPYVKSCLRFGTSKSSLSGQQYVGSLDHPGRITMELDNRHGYSECSKFSLYVNGNNPRRSDSELISILQGLHKDLEDPRYLADFARELRNKPPVPRLDSIEEIRPHHDTDKRVVEKVLHEVRLYIYLLLTRSQQQEQIRVNVTRLRKIQKEITRVRPTEAVVKEICERFIKDLERIQASQYHCNSEDFYMKLEQLWHTLQEIQIIRVSGNSGTSLPSTSQVANQRQETIL